MWESPNDSASVAILSNTTTLQAEALVRELGIAPVTARLLCIRGISDLTAARRFLSPSLDDLLDPFALTDMTVAVDRILAAIANGERIAVHGDYDVDGVTSTVILRRALELLGADVIHFLPERLRDGYGLQPASLDRLAAEHVHLVISVDCGIRGVEAATHAKTLGLDLIITDHHEPDSQLPDALAIINPEAPRLQLPGEESCRRRRRAQAGAGAVIRSNREPLGSGFRESGGHRDVGRRGAAHGRKSRDRQARPRACCPRDRTRSGYARSSTVCGLTGKEIDSYHIGFVLAPRVNAAGRMSTPDIAARLLLASDDGMAG